MREVRRFELRRGNKEEYWEIYRYDNELVTRQGRLNETTPSPSNSEFCEDFREAQLEYDKLIQQKLKRGFLEVHQVGAASNPLEYTNAYMSTIQGNSYFTLNREDLRTLLDWLISNELMNRHIPVHDISKWEHRTLRKLSRSSGQNFRSLEELPAELEEEYFYLWKALSLRDRAFDDFDAIPAFKFTNPNYWIVSPRECQIIAEGCHKKLHRIIERSERDGKVLPRVQSLRRAFMEFHQQAAELGGYEVRPASIQFTTIMKNKSYFFDAISWNKFYGFLEQFDMWDETSLAHHEAGIELDDYVDQSVKINLGLEDEPELPIETAEFNEVSDALIEAKAVLQEISGSEKLLEKGFAANITTLSQLNNALGIAEEDPEMVSKLEPFLSEYYTFKLNEYATVPAEESEGYDRETLSVVTEYITDIRSLLNEAYRLKHESTDILLTSGENDLFNINTMSSIIELLDFLYPEIEEYEFDEFDAPEDRYDYRPEGIIEALMTQWIDMLGEAGALLSVLRGQLRYEQNLHQLKSEFRENFPTAVSLFAYIIECYKLHIDYVNSRKRLRKRLLSVSSDNPMRLLKAKFLDLSVFWRFSVAEVQVLLSNLETSEYEDTALLDGFRTFLSYAEDLKGFTLRASEE